MDDNSLRSISEVESFAGDGQVGLGSCLGGAGTWCIWGRLMRSVDCASAARCSMPLPRWGLACVDGHMWKVLNGRDRVLGEGLAFTLLIIDDFCIRCRSNVAE